MSFKVLDTAALTVDLPEYGLKSGDIGTVVQLYSADTIEVEFVRPAGHTQALVTISTHQLRELAEQKPLSVRHPRAS